MRIATAFLVFLCCAAIAWSESPPKSRDALSLDEMHDGFVADFLGSQGFGPNRIPTTFEPGTVAIRNERFTIKSRELIGIVKHDPPVVHEVYDHVIASKAKKQPASVARQVAAPQVSEPEQKAQAAKPRPEKTRKLTEFERAALTLFRNGGELSHGIQGADRVVVGPIRATSQCIKCHENSKEGEILGALTYRLSAIEVPKNDVTPP